MADATRAHYRDTLNDAFANTPERDEINTVIAKVQRVTAWLNARAPRSQAQAISDSLVQTHTLRPHYDRPAIKGAVNGLRGMCMEELSVDWMSSWIFMECEGRTEWQDIVEEDVLADFEAASDAALHHFGPELELVLEAVAA